MIAVRTSPSDDPRASDLVLMVVKLLRRSIIEQMVHVTFTGNALEIAVDANQIVITAPEAARCDEAIFSHTVLTVAERLRGKLI